MSTLVYVGWIVKAKMSINAETGKFHSLQRILDDYDELTPAQEAVSEKFKPVEFAYSSTADKGYEILTNVNEYCNWIDCDEESIIIFDAPPERKRPTQDWIDLLKGTMMYEYIEVKFAQIVVVV